MAHVTRQKQVRKILPMIAPPSDLFFSSATSSARTITSDASYGKVSIPYRLQSNSLYALIPLPLLGFNVSART